MQEFYIVKKGTYLPSVYAVQRKTAQGVIIGDDGYPIGVEKEGSESPGGGGEGGYALPVQIPDPTGPFYYTIRAEYPETQDPEGERTPDPPPHLPDHGDRRAILAMEELGYAVTSIARKLLGNPMTKELRAEQSMAVWRPYRTLLGLQQDELSPVEQYAVDETRRDLVLQAKLDVIEDIVNWADKSPVRHDLHDAGVFDALSQFASTYRGGEKSKTLG